MNKTVGFDEKLVSGNTQMQSERIAVLEERSKHGATKEDLNKRLFALFITLITILGGLLIHLHNISLGEIAEIRLMSFELTQSLPGA